jgi:predicted HAD superfamily phosphohydrolase
MTAAQLARLAELSAYAADFFAITNPQAARAFSDTALRADILSDRVRREEQQARSRVGLIVSAEMADGVTLKSTPGIRVCPQRRPFDDRGNS